MASTGDWSPKHKWMSDKGERKQRKLKGPRTIPNPQIESSRYIFTFLSLAREEF